MYKLILHLIDQTILIYKTEKYPIRNIVYTQSIQFMNKFRYILI